MNKSLAVVATCVLLAGCGKAGAPTASVASTSNINAQGMFNRLPADRLMTAEENELDFDGLRKVATKEAQKFHKHAVLVDAGCNRTNEKGGRAVSGGNMTFEFRTTAAALLRVTVRGDQLHFSQALLSALATAKNQAVMEPTVTAAAAIATARKQAGITTPYVFCGLAQPNGASHPFYLIEDDSFLGVILARSVRVDAITGEVASSTALGGADEATESVHQAASVN
jgi:hypothetical protein